MPDEKHCGKIEVPRSGKNGGLTERRCILLVSGHLAEKNGYYYIVLSLLNESGKRKPKWIATGLTVKGNKRRAENMLIQERLKHDSKEVSLPGAASGLTASPDMLFADYMLYWLRQIRPRVEVDTYEGYRCIVERRIVPYFRPMNLTLAEVKPIHIQEFYTYCMNDLNLSANTTVHYHANLTNAMNYALKNDLILVDPMNKVTRPKVEEYTGKFYSQAELECLFRVFQGDEIEFAVLMAAFYGLRRSEVVGLRWQAIDFEDNTISIEHTVIQTKVDGKQVIIEKDRAKNKSSHRTLPLVPQYRALLLQMKQRQDENRKLCGNAYHESDYIFVDELGERRKPNYITQHFALILEKNGLRKIRFHDLRHSCASLLLKNRVPMKQIQEWLGHSNFSTTANLYAHLDTSSKQNTAETLIGRIDLSGLLNSQATV